MPIPFSPRCVMQAITVLVLLAPNSPDAAAQKDIARLDGAWVVTAAENL